MLGFGDGCLMLAVAGAWAAFGHAGFFDTGGAASVLGLEAGWPAYAVFFLFAAAAVARAAVWPLHSWMPGVAARSPAVLSSYVPAALNMIPRSWQVARIARIIAASLISPPSPARRRCRHFRSANPRRRPVNSVNSPCRAPSRFL